MCGVGVTDEFCMNYNFFSSHFACGFQIKGFYSQM